MINTSDTMFCMAFFRFLKIDYKLIRRIFLVIFIISLSFSGGYIFGYKGYTTTIDGFPKVNIDRTNPEDMGELDFSLFWKVWDTLGEKYYDPDKLIDSKMVYGAISGMVAAIGDPYTAFIPPKQYKVVQEDLSGSFEGVGIQIGFKGTQLAVVAPLIDSPAQAAGVKAGDLILGIKDEAKDLDISTAGININDAVQYIRGPAGSKVTLILLREGVDEPIEAEIVRESIDVPSVKVTYEGDDGQIAYVRILKFAGETEGEWEKYVPEMLSKTNLKGMIIDVRNNPGGYLQGAIDLASDFLEMDDLVVIEEAGSKKIRTEYRVEKLGRFREIPLVVLVNEGSASASEIFAGAIKDNDRGEIVGVDTFGKGTIQEPQVVNGGGGLHITIARWLTPSELWVNEKGLKPDINVEDNEETEEDEQFQEALRMF
jgi:carboxyl-terminal processing protease